MYICIYVYSWLQMPIRSSSWASRESRQFSLSTIWGIQDTIDYRVTPLCPSEGLVIEIGLVVAVGNIQADKSVILCFRGRMFLMYGTLWTVLQKEPQQLLKLKPTLGPFYSNHSSISIFSTPLLCYHHNCSSRLRFFHLTFPT